MLIPSFCFLAVCRIETINPSAKFGYQPVYLFVTAVAICGAVAVRTASRDNASIGAGRTAGSGRDAASVKAISVAVPLAGGAYDAVT